MWFSNARKCGRNISVRVRALAMKHCAMGADSGEAEMRALTIAAVMFALVVPAHSQGMPGGKKHRGNEQKAGDQKPKVDDKAYNAALSRIPNQKYDPWQIVRPPSPGAATH
jgi:hypothetical protein